MSLKNRQDSYRKGYAAGLAGKELTSRYRLRTRQASYERGYFAGMHGRYLVNEAIRAEVAFAEHDRARCVACIVGQRFRAFPCREVTALMAETVKAYAQIRNLDRAAFHAWQSHYYSEPVEESDTDLLAAFA